MRPDLAKVHARTLEFSCRVTPQPEQLEHLRTAFGRSDSYKDFPWFFFNRYRASHVLHTSAAVVNPSKREANSLALQFSFFARTRVTADFETKPKPVADLVRLLSEWDAEATFNCSVGLLYPKKGWTSRIALPMRLLEYDDLPFDEFRGFRAVKVEDGKTAYSVIIDRPENKALSHSVLFSQTAAINDVLADIILGQGAHISSLFIHPGQE